MSNPKTPNLNLNKVDRSSPTTTTFNTKPIIDDNADIIDGKFDPTTGHKHTGTAGDAPKIDSTGLVNGAATDTVIGNRTIDDTITAATGADTPTRLWSKLGNIIKQITGGANWWSVPSMTISAIITALGLKAPLDSPALTGMPTAPTATAGTNSTQIATAAFVQAAINALINGSPGALDTLKELADAMGDDPNFAATVTNSLATKLNKAGDAMTGPLSVSSATGKQLSVNLFMDIGSSNGGEGSILNNAYYDFTANTYKYRITNAVLGARGIRFSYVTGLEFFDMGSIACTADATFTPVWMKIWHDGNSTASLTTNGYQKLASGLIEQWGQVSIPANSTVTITFPTAFPTEMSSVTALSDTAGCYVTRGGTASNTQLTLYNNGGASILAYWFAVGR